jgi:MFS transporter, DHA2 family, glioxin efflux transporter
MFSGFAVTKTGVYVPWMLLSGALTAVRYGLISTLDIDDTLGKIIDYQTIASMDFGFCIQMPFTAMRNVLKDDDIPIANALVVLFRGFGTLLSLSIGQAIFLQTLQQRLHADFPWTEVQTISDLGAGEVDSDHISNDTLPLVARVYNKSMQTTMYFAIAAAIVVFFAASLVKWKKVDLSNRQKEDKEVSATSSQRDKN